MSTDYLFQQSEVIGKRVSQWFGKFNVARNLVKKGQVEVIGERDFRVNYLTQEGGRFGTYNPDGGALGRGTAAKGGTLISSFFSLRLNFELTELAKRATSSRQISQINALKRATKAGVPEFSNYCDMVFHGSGSAVMATATAHAVVSSKSVYTMDTITGVQNLRRGQYVMVYDTGLTAARDSGASFMIEQIDYENRKVYLSATVTSAAATDKLVFEGVSGASPTSVNGIKYFHSSATSGTTLGVNRANELEIVTPYVSAGGKPTHMKALLLNHKALKKRGEIPNGMVFLVAPEQEANMRSQVTSISNFDLSRGNITKDIGAKSQKTFTFGGTPCRLDIHQDTDRIDGLVPGDWIRAVLPGGDIGYYEDDNGNRFFNLWAADGGPAAGTWFGWVLHENFVNQNPGGAAFMDGCTQPTY